MATAGSKLIPVIILTTLLFIGKFFASEIIFYTFSTPKTTTLLNENLSWKSPNRTWLFLDGEWGIKDSKWERQIGKVNVPFSFSGGNQIFLEKEFELDTLFGSQFYFNADWINGRLQISINGQALFRGSRNYLPLRLEIPVSFLRQGKNTLQIALTSNENDRGQLPSWTPINVPRISSGILSSVYLEIVPAFHIESVRVSPTVTDSLIHFKGRIMLSLPFQEMGNSKIAVRYRSTDKLLFEKQVQIVDSTANEIVLPEWQTDEINPWPVEAPKKYWVEVALDSSGKSIDLLRQEIALRRVEMINGKFRLNGSDLSINGVNYVYQTPDGNELFDPELIQQDLRSIKERGFNAVRVILRPLPEQFYRLCDELGILCFQDLPFVLTDSEGADLKSWESYYDDYLQLTGGFSSIAAAGVAYQFDGESRRQQKKLDHFFANLNSAPALRYVTSLNPGLLSYKNIDFQLVDVIDRNAVGKEILRLEQLLDGYPYFLTAFSKPISYRADPTTITHDLIQIRTLRQKVNEEMQQGKVAGQFIMTYNDFFLNFPSLQNGSQKDLYPCSIGLVDLKRNPRQFFGDANASEGESADDASTVSEAQSAKSYLYVILGLCNLFLFLYSYRRFTEFRHNIGYSMKKTHGFFVNLQERIIIPYGQSLLLILVISINGAIMWSSIIYYFRNNLILDYLLSVFLSHPKSKLTVSRIIWNQPLFLITGVIFTFIVFYGSALLVKLLSLFGEPRVTFRQSLAVSAWSAVPLVFLLPFGIIFYNLLLTLKSYWIILVVLLYFHVWIYLRWINGTRVLTERPYFRIFLLFTFLGLFIAAMVVILYQYQINLIDHLRFAYHLSAWD